MPSRPFDLWGKKIIRAHSITWLQKVQNISIYTCVLYSNHRVDDYAGLDSECATELSYYLE